MGRDVAVDEAMIKFQGRSALKQYLPMKPVKRGIKVWVLADSSYFHKFQVYAGKEKSAEVVKDLTSSLKDHVYFDNLLEEDGIYACGTVRSDRLGFPEDLKDPDLVERYRKKHKIIIHGNVYMVMILTLEGST